MVHIIEMICGAGLAAGITEELIFRGLIMHLVERQWNKTIAILAPSIFFALLHIPGMASTNTADVLLVLVAGTTVGAMFSLITYHSGSIFAGAIVHGTWNLLLGGGLVRTTGTQNMLTSFFIYTPTSPSPLLTGGAFGIEYHPCRQS